MMYASTIVDQSRQEFAGSGILDVVAELRRNGIIDEKVRSTRLTPGCDHRSKA
jgi:hypothetical protein